jgi:hypothetical protein
LIWVNAANVAAQHERGMTAISARSLHVTEDGWHLQPLVKDEAALVYPLILALDGGGAEPLPAWRARVEAWLKRRRGERDDRGVMTLRTSAGVIAALFFYALPAEPAAILVIPLLRAAEPLGTWHGLAATLRVVRVMATDRGGGGVLLCAEREGSAAWAHVTTGMERVGRQAGYVPRGADWFLPIATDDGVVVLPQASSRPWRRGA